MGAYEGAGHQGPFGAAGINQTGSGTYRPIWGWTGGRRYGPRWQGVYVNSTSEHANRSFEGRRQAKRDGLRDEPISVAKNRPAFGRLQHLNSSRWWHGVFLPRLEHYMGRIANNRHLRQRGKTFFRRDSNLGKAEAAAGLTVDNRHVRRRKQGKCPGRPLDLPEQISTNKGEKMEPKGARQTLGRKAPRSRLQFNTQPPPMPHSFTNQILDNASRSADALFLGVHRGCGWRDDPVAGARDNYELDQTTGFGAKPDLRRAAPGRWSKWV